MTTMLALKTARTAELKSVNWVFQNVKLEHWKSFKPGECYTSSLSHAEGDEEISWYIKVFPNGLNDGQEGTTSPFIFVHDLPLSRTPLKVIFSSTIYFEDNVGRLTSTNLYRKLHTFTKENESFGEEIQQRAITYKNAFSVNFTVEYRMPTTTASISSVPSVVQDLQQLLLNRSGADVCFIIEGKEIKAHKQILSARSPVFAAMLGTSGMKESTQNRVDILGIPVDIFEALLCSIYTDRVDFDQIINVGDLLVAANKYLLPLLKFECQLVLSDRIKKENCSEMLLLADLHNAVFLKKSSLKFLRVNKADVMGTDGWKNLKQAHPELAFSVLESVLLMDS